MRDRAERDRDGIRSDLISHPIASTSRSFDKDAVGAGPFARAVVKIRGRGLDGDMEEVGLHVAVKTAPSTDQTRARKRYRACSHYVATTFIGDFFPPDPLPQENEKREWREGSSLI